MSNAVKFTPSGGSVSLDLTREGDCVVVQVADTGVGIRPELLPYIFERFQQGDSGASRAHGGLGLGLAIAKQLVELHGGTISAASDGHGRGARFTLRMPLKKEFGLAPSMQANVSPPSLEGLRVLLVEDEANTREATCILLEKHGAQVQSVESAAAAREAYKIQPPHIVVSDIGMPVEDGYLLIKQLRDRESRESLRRVPALALTAFAGVEDHDRALAAGYDLHLSKPVDPDELVRQVANLGRAESAAG